MEISQLSTEKYIDERYKELRRKRPDDKDNDLNDGSPPSASSSTCSIKMKSLTPTACESNDAQASFEEQMKLNASIVELESMWPITPLDKKLTVLFTLLEQMANACGATTKLHLNDGSEKKANTQILSVTTLEALPLSTQLAVKLFFRLIQSIRTRSQASGNFTTLLRLIHQLPRIIMDLPSLSLSPDQQLETNDKSIFDEIFSTVQQVSISTREDQEAALVTLFGLSIKRGRLYHILVVVRLLLQMDQTLSMQAALPFLQELADSKAQEPENASDDNQVTGYLMSFGKGDHGKLGHGTCSHPTCADGKCTENKAVPTMLEATRDMVFKKIDSLSTHSVAITTTGELFTWGNGEKFRLGHGETTKEYTPRPVEAFREKPRVKDVACGLGHTVVLLVSGEVYAWGNGGNGRLGLGDSVDQVAPMKLSFTDDIEREKGGGVSAVFCGASHTLAVTVNGALYSWGKNNQGQCGHGHTNDQLTPAEVIFFDEMELTVSTVAGGWEHTLICTTHGKAYACGSGYKDSRRAGLPPVLGLGLNDTERRVKPAMISALDDCIGVACGWDHSLAVTRDGSVYSWGSGSNGKLGHGDEDNRDIPTKIQSLQGKTIKDVRAGCEHTTAITQNGEMYTWGHSDSGRLGHGDNLTRKTPCFVESFAWQGYRPVSIAVGDKYNLVLVQPLTEIPTTNNQLINDSDVTPKASQTLPIDDNIPLSVATFTLHLMTQLDRLTDAYMPHDNSQLLDRLRQLDLNRTQATTAKPYAVDVCVDTFNILLDVLECMISPTKGEPHQTVLAVDSRDEPSQSLILTMLRLVKLNLFYLLGCPQVVLPPTTLTKLYELLKGIATTPSEKSTSDLTIHAADALKIGFQIFYPSPIEQHELLWQLMHMESSSDLIFLQALTDRLCQDYVLVDLMNRFFAQSHSCPRDVPAIDQWSKENLNSNDLLQLMITTLKECAQSEQPEPRMLYQLKLLAAIQTHLFASWNTSHCSHCLWRVLGPYLEALVGESLTLLRKVHKRLLKDSDLSTLRSTFFHHLVPLAIECISVTRLRSDAKLCRILLPLLLPMLKFLDEVVYKSSQDAKSSEQVTPDIQWIAELESATTHLIGRFTCELIANPNTTTRIPSSIPSCIRTICRHGPMQEDANEKLLRLWESQHVFEVEHELDPPEPLANDVTLVDHLAILDWVNGTGILEDFHQYMLRHVIPKPDPIQVVPLAIVVWHSSLLPSIFSCIATVGATELRTSSDLPPPPDTLLQVWIWVLEICSGFSSGAWDSITMQGRQLLQYYPAQCSFTPESDGDILQSTCSYPSCTLMPPVKNTLSLLHLLQILSEPITQWPMSTLKGLPLKFAGLSILHELLCKLTSMQAKAELLRLLVAPLEHTNGYLSIGYNTWQEPHVEFTPNISTHGSSSMTTIQMIEADLHTQFGYFYHRKIQKSIENLFIRLAKLISSPESDLVVKKRAMNAWSVRFHDISILQMSGILHALGDMLQHDASIQSASTEMNHTSDAIHNSPHGLPATLCLPPRLRPVEKLVYLSTASYNVHQTCWKVFTWLCKQLIRNESSSSFLNSLRPSSSSRALFCASPRKRLSLPLKMIVATLEETIDYMYQVLLAELTYVKDALVCWNRHATSMDESLKQSQVILLADPHVVSSVNTVFHSAKEKAPENGWTLSLWAHIDTYNAVPLILIANGDSNQHQMTITIEDKGKILVTWNQNLKYKSTSSLKCRGWTHVACTFTKELTEIYMDGQLDASFDGASPMLVHPIFTVGGLVDVQKPDHHTSHILLDDLIVHEIPLDATQIQTIAKRGSLLFRIKQRQLVDDYCESLLGLLTWLAHMKTPSIDQHVPLLLQLLPLCPSSAHGFLFQILACVLPSVAPSFQVFNGNLLQYLMDQFGLIWFSATHSLHGPSDFYQALTLRKDNCVAQLLRAGSTRSDSGVMESLGRFEHDCVASWLILDQQAKSKAHSLLRMTRSSLVDSFVNLFSTLVQTPCWADEFFKALNVETPTDFFTMDRSQKYTVKPLPYQLVLALYVLGGHASSALPTKMKHEALGLCEWFLTQPMSIDGHGCANDLDLDVQLALSMHIRIVILRQCVAQSKHFPSTCEWIMHSSSIMSAILSHAILSLRTALASLFGKEYDVVAKMENVRIFIDWIADDAVDDLHKRRSVVENMSAVLFERLPYVNTSEISPWWILNAAQNLHIMGGEVEVDEYRIKGLQHFPTVKLNGVSITSGTGIWFYEVVLLSDGLMQIGWIDSTFESDALQGQGVGDHASSWAYDGFRRKKWNVGALDYGEKWRNGDVIGVLIDTDRCEMHYYVNGKPLGVAFEGLRLSHPIYPAISLNVDQSVQFHFEASQFLYVPPFDKLQPVSQAILGHVCEHSTTRTTTQDVHEQDSRRTELIEGLIGLGFPPEWALRCARETSMDLSESGAIAWIMEQMENDTSQMPRPPLHGFNTSRDNLQLLDGFMDERKKNQQTVAIPKTVHPDDSSMIELNPYLSEEFCEDSYLDEPFSPQKLPPTSRENVSSDKGSNYMMSLAETCRDEEILPLYLISETALGIWYSQDIATQLVQQSQSHCTNAFPEKLFLKFLQHAIRIPQNSTRNRQGYARILYQMCRANMEFVSLLVQDVIEQFQAASAKEYAQVSFYSGSKGISTETTSSVNMEWGTWIAGILLDFARANEPAQSIIYAPPLWKSLLAAGSSSNATLRHCALVVMTTFIKENAAQATLVSFEHVVEWLAVKLRKEKPTRVLYSDYTQSLFHFVVALDSILSPAYQSPCKVVDSELLLESVTSCSSVVSFSGDMTCYKHFEIAFETVVDGKYMLSPYVTLAEPVISIDQVSYSFTSLLPDTNYSLNLVHSTEDATDISLSFRTNCEAVLELDPLAMGSNLELCNRNMSVRNRVNKKWHGVRASVSYTSGVHVWDVRIDKCVSKNIFVGICTADASMENYIGSDAWGWGFLANKAVWHNKSKLQTYGDIFKQGDVITVTLNLDRGTLSFARNGESFGVGVEHLQANEAGYYPALSMYNKDDQVTFMPHESNESKATSGLATVMQYVRDMRLLQSLFTSPDESIYRNWVAWMEQRVRYVVTTQNDIVLVDVTDQSCAPFGFRAGDVLFTPKGMCTVVGVAHHQLWHNIELHSAARFGAKQYGAWTMQICRDMLTKPGEFPLTRTHLDPTNSETISDVPTFEEFIAQQSRWTPELDDALIDHLHCLANNLSSVFDLKPAQILAASDCVPTMSSTDCLIRMGILHGLNQLLRELLPFFLSQQSSCLQLLRRCRHLSVRSIGSKLCHDLLKKSTTLTHPASAEELDEDPIEFPKCKLTLASMPCVPYWEWRGEANNASRSPDCSVLYQLAAFFERTDSRDLRRHYIAPQGSLYATANVPRTFRVLCDELKDQNAAYSQIFREVAKEIQSPRLPLFVPLHAPMLSTMINLNEKESTLYYALGQVIGIAWRSELPLPWFFDMIVWKYIVQEEILLKDWVRVHPSPVLDTAIAMATWSNEEFNAAQVPFGISVDKVDGQPIVREESRDEYVAMLLESLIQPYRPALDAIVAGLRTIVPTSCLCLFSAKQLQRLIASTLDMIHLQETTIYGGDLTRDSAGVVALWKIVHDYSMEYQRHFYQFLFGHETWHSNTRLELRNSSALQSGHDDTSPHDTSFGYPYVERVSEWSSVLYLPEYTGMDILQKKLLLALNRNDCV